MSSDKRDFDREAAAWDDNPGRLRMTNAIADAIAQEIKLNSEMDVMDFGCGTGIITVSLSPLVRSVTAVDGSQGMLDVLQAKMKKFDLPNIKTFRLDFAGGEMLHGHYDMVVCSMTLHHVKGIGLLLDQFYKVLNAGGHLCVADLDPDGGQFHENNDGVEHFGFERQTLSDALSSAGFSDLRLCTATEVVKPVAGAGMRSFSVFLIIGEKNHAKGVKDKK